MVVTSPCLALLDWVSAHSAGWDAGLRCSLLQDVFAAPFYCCSNRSPNLPETLDYSSLHHLTGPISRSPPSVISSVHMVPFLWAFQFKP